MKVPRSFVVSSKCRDSLALSGDYPACSDVDLTTLRPVCELRSDGDARVLTKVSGISGAQVLGSMNVDKYEMY